MNDDETLMQTTKAVTKIQLLLFFPIFSTAKQIKL